MIGERTKTMAFVEQVLSKSVGDVIPEQACATRSVVAQLQEILNDDDGGNILQFSLPVLDNSSAGR